jgi:hypothetical protein
MGRDAEDEHSAGADLHQEQQVDTGQPDRVDVQEIAGQNPLGLRGQELRLGRPVRRGAPWSGWNTR